MDAREQILVEFESNAAVFIQIDIFGYVLCKMLTLFSGTDMIKRLGMQKAHGLFVQFGSVIFQSTFSKFLTADTS